MRPGSALEVDHPIIEMNAAATDLAADTPGVRPPDLVDSARRGDPAAWEHILHQYGPRIVRFAASRGVRDPEDVAQDVMGVAAERIHRFRGDEGDLRSWLFTIAYRRCADYHRRSYRRPEEPTDRLPETVDGDGADTAVWSDGEAGEAFAALNILDPRERQVITLRVISELGTREVAAALGLTRTNVRVIQSRALGKLRRYLENNGGYLDKRFRNTGLVVAIAVERMRLLTRLRDMGETLPTDGRLGALLEELRGGGGAAPVPLVEAPPPSVEATARTITDLGGGLAHTIGVAAIVTGTAVGGIFLAPPSADPAPTPTTAAPAAPAEEVATPEEVQAGPAEEPESTDAAENKADGRLRRLDPPAAEAALAVPEPEDVTERLESSPLVHDAVDVSPPVEESPVPVDANVEEVADALADTTDDVAARPVETTLEEATSGPTGSNPLTAEEPDETDPPIPSDPDPTGDPHPTGSLPLPGG